MKRWKKNLVAGAVLVTVCAGIYVNWIYTEDQSVANLNDTIAADKLLSDDLMVMGEASELENMNAANTQSEYFSAVRLSRQQARDSAVGLLQEAMAYTDTAESEQSNLQLEQIVQTALSEAQIESLVIAKGYSDCVAYISNAGISVAVASPENGLAERDVAVIADIVMTQTDFGLDEIRVVEVV